MTDNPYQAQTDANTSTTWLQNQAPVDIDLAGIGEYAANMVTIKKNLEGHTGHLELMTTLPMQAWTGSTPEGTYIMRQMAGNYAELRQYLLHLGFGLENIGMAAQTIADAFSNTDGWSAATLNTVLYAFGDPNVKPPSGLPPFVTGLTYVDAVEQSRQQAAQSSSTAGVAWTNAGRRMNGDGGVTLIGTSSDGRTREVTTYTVPGTGQVVERTTVFAADGTTLGTTAHRISYSYGQDTITKTTATLDPDGNVTGAVADTTTYSDGRVVGESTTQLDANGEPTATRSTETTTTPDGNGQVITTRQDGTTVREIHLGAPTEGVAGLGDTPVKDAIDDVRARYDD